jgi:hypothetical protein
VALPPSTRQLLRALHRGATVERTVLASWRTSDGERASGRDVHILVNAGLAEFYEWGMVSGNVRIGTKARIRRREAAAQTITKPIDLIALAERAVKEDRS